MNEEIYNDFTTKLLPKIASGLAITKGYFIDLFGRYVKYLIVTDSMWLVTSLVVLSISVIVFFIYKDKALEASDNYEVWPIFFFIVLTMSSIFGVVGAAINVNHVVKDIYIPEIRIYQSLTQSSSK